jgi:NAD(P)-dependent dehydrogenase (short-subunit alcohol dehydrogenase family)
MVQHLGRIDILVNNAGLAPDNLAENVREEDFDLTLAVNLKGTFFASQAARRVMIRQKSDHIINLSSQAGFVALPTESVYCMTKAAIAHLTKCLAVEWGKYNITVNAVAPTFIRTPGTESSLADPEFRSDVIERIAALHRIWRADGRGRRGRIPCLERSVPYHGRDNSHRWRVDRQVSKDSSLAGQLSVVTRSPVAALRVLKAQRAAVDAFPSVVSLGCQSAVLGSYGVACYGALPIFRQLCTDSLSDL